MGNTLLSEVFTRFRFNQALCIQNTAYSYGQLDDTSRLIAAKLTGSKIAILGGKTFETFAGVAAAIRSGRTYIPLNTALPDRTLHRQITLASPDVILVDHAMRAKAERLLRSIEKPVTVICPEPIDRIRDQRHRCISWADAPLPPAEEIDGRSEAPLYQMFTSGTTGQPKRISIPRCNVISYLAEIQSAFDFRESDRFSQFFQLSFDLSVHDLLVAWTCGGCLFVPTPAQLLDPVGFARKNDLSVWFSVPSLVRLAMMTKKLPPGSLPKLRHALFCGEALNWEIAKAFGEAAPDALITNLYGPTEATIAITRHRIDRPAGSRTTSRGSVPIGKPFATQEAVVVDPDLQPVADGDVGELLLGGSQLASGYCGDPEQTASRFLDLRIKGFDSRRWYRTGDLVRYEGDELIFVGREDTQIKFRGHRIELGEIEAALADAAKSPLAVVMPSTTPEDGAIDRLVALVATPHVPISEVKPKLRDRLPGYMQPAEIITIPDHGDWWNVNGKVDRERLFRWYRSKDQEGTHERPSD